MSVTAMAVGIVRGADGRFEFDRSVMSDGYWSVWNDAEQAKIDADIEKNRKADAELVFCAAPGSEVKIEQLDHEFRFGAHIFNFDQLGKKEYNDAYKASYGEGGLFNQATVAFYWNKYEPIPGRLRAFGDYEDTERFWNSLTREEAMDHPFWRRPAPGPVIEYLKRRDIAIHGHILVWGLAKPFWIYDEFCPEDEKRAFDAIGITRHSAFSGKKGDHWAGGYYAKWRGDWTTAYGFYSEEEIAAMAPVFTRRMREIFRKRVFDVAKDFGELANSWDVVNESSQDAQRYDCAARTGLKVWKSVYGLMPGDYPLDALLDAKAAFPATAKFAINDWNMKPAFLEQVKNLEKEGAKIDIVGCQMHIFNTNDCARLAKGDTDINWVGTPATIQDRLDMMAKTGKRLHVSEITITSPGSDDRSRMIQAILTYNIYRKWFSHPAMMGITWWNTVDGGGVKGEPLVSGLFTADMQKKPAYLALDRLINHEWKTRLAAQVEKVGGGGEGGVVKFRGFRGKYRATWKCAECGEDHTREFYLDGDGLKEVPDGVNAHCRQPRVVRNFAVNGKPVELAADKSLIDLAAVTGAKLEKGADGTEWATIEFTVDCAEADGVRIMIHNDYYGKYSVNGSEFREYNGPYQGYEPLPCALKAGVNKIVFKSRAGSGGNWNFGAKVLSRTSL